MQEIINSIIKKHRKLFGENLNITKINVGFTNTIYNINDSFIVKICTDQKNEENFQHEINFYNSNFENHFIPKLYYSNIEKKDVPYYYEIMEKVKGVSLYNVWHTFSENQREEIVKQICVIMKKFHSNVGQAYDWVDYFQKHFSKLYKKAKELSIFTEKEEDLMDYAYSKFESYLKSEEFVFIHNDLHFDNIFFHNGEIKVIDFERSMFAPKDFELDIFFRMVRKPWKFASEEAEQYTKVEDYTNIKLYMKKYYPELMNIPFLTQRLAIYDMVYFLEHLVNSPEIKELKIDVIEAAKIVAQK